MSYQSAPSSMPSPATQMSDGASVQPNPAFQPSQAPFPQFRASPVVSTAMSPIPNWSPTPTPGNTQQRGRKRGRNNPAPILKKPKTREVIRHFWEEEHEVFLLTVLKNEKLDEQTATAGFKDAVWKELTARLIELYPSLGDLLKELDSTDPEPLTSKKTRDKYDSFKRVWRLWEDHKHSTSSWEVDPVIGVPQSDQDTMDTYFKAHPERARFRSELPAHFDLCRELFGEKLAARAQARAAMGSPRDESSTPAITPRTRHVPTNTFSPNPYNTPGPLQQPPTPLTHYPAPAPAIQWPPRSSYTYTPHINSMTPALLTAVDSRSHVHLIIGSNPLAGARCSRAIEVGAKPKLIAPEEIDLYYGIAKRIDEGQVEWIKHTFRDEDLTTLGRAEVDGVVDAVFVTLEGRNPLRTHISNLCRRLRIPVNVVDAPSLCTFTLLSTHTDGPLQIGITTSGKGCKLASRIRREIASSLPSNLGQAVQRLGAVRRRIYEEDHAAELALELEGDGEEDDAEQSASFNKLVTPEDAEAAKTRRMRWLAQICEYWPLSRLAMITDQDVEAVLRSYRASTSSGLNPTDLDQRRQTARIILAGSGPGHPDLLTTATHKAILSADLILADKLVPSAVLDLVPRRSTIYIARKFPGNADKAQEELLQMGLEGLRNGYRVVRLKQGDPYIYGRGAEEYDFFRAHGYIPIVLPGITSALSAPLFAHIPPTHRSVADQVLICTGTGRKGAAPDPPEYVETRTVVFLMALHRLSALVDSLVNETKKWPKETPCAVLERASCSDQRIIRTTLEFVCSAVEEEGSRPPGLLLVGKACEVLCKSSQRWVVEDGFRGLDGLEIEGDLAKLRAVQQGA